MNILEFKAAIRPQLEARIHKWFWHELEVSDMRRLGVNFREHMRGALIDEKADRCLRNMVEELPISLKTAEREYPELVIKHVLELFMVSMRRYQHLDRSASLSLRIHAYEHRMKNLLAELLYRAHTPKARLRQSLEVRKVEYSLCGAITNTWGQIQPRHFETHVSA